MFQFLILVFVCFVILLKWAITLEFQSQTVVSLVSSFLFNVWSFLLQTFKNIYLDGRRSDVGPIRLGGAQSTRRRLLMDEALSKTRKNILKIKTNSSLLQQKDLVKNQWNWSNIEDIFIENWKISIYGGNHALRCALGINWKIFWTQWWI